MRLIHPKLLTTLCRTAIYALAAVVMSAHANETPKSESSQPETSACPSEFYDVPMPKNAKQCQPFDADFPASMVFFIAASPDKIVANYLAEMPELALKGNHNNRVLMVNSKQNIRIIVSPDGEGAQVDILVLAVATEDGSPSITE